MPQKLYFKATENIQKKEIQLARGAENGQELPSLGPFINMG